MRVTRMLRFVDALMCAALRTCLLAGVGIGAGIGSSSAKDVARQGDARPKYSTLKCGGSDWIPEIEHRIRAVDRKLDGEHYMKKLAAATVESDPQDDAKLEIQTGCVGSIMMRSNYVNNVEIPGLDCASGTHGKVVWQFGDAFTYEKLKFFIALKRYAGSYNQALLKAGVLDEANCKEQSYSTDVEERSLRTWRGR